MRVILATFASFVALFAVLIEAAPTASNTQPRHARHRTAGQLVAQGCGYIGARWQISAAIRAPMRSEMVGKGAFLPRRSLPLLTGIVA
jgi:hypothetical protein